MNNGNSEENTQNTLEYKEELNNKHNNLSEIASNLPELEKIVKEDNEFDLEKFYEQRQSKIEEILNKKTEKEAKLFTPAKKETSSKKETLNNSKKGKSFSKEKRNYSTEKSENNKGRESDLKERNILSKTVKKDKKIENPSIKKDHLNIKTYQDFSRNRDDSIN